MIHAEQWMTELTDKLKARFQHRLLLTGLQGSYQRGEAHPESDIDAVIILDTLSMDDLTVYRSILQTMPEHDNACGFIAGKQELWNWPGHELFQFVQDTHVYYGTFHGIVPAVGKMDAENSAKIGASGLYHTCCHTAVHDPSNIDVLRSLYKGAFFVLQAVYYLRHGEYIHTKRELLPLLEGDEQEILRTGMDWNACQHSVSDDSDHYFDLILRWTKAILQTRFIQA